MFCCVFLSIFRGCSISLLPPFFESTSLHHILFFPSKTQNRRFIAVFTKKKELLKPNHCILSVRVGGNQNSTCAIAGQCHGGKIGVCYGRNADDLPAPDKVAQLIQQQSIKYVRIYDSNIDVIKAFANTGVELMVGVLSRTAIAKTAYASSWAMGCHHRPSQISVG